MDAGSVGAVPGVVLGRLRIDERLQQALGQCVLYSRRDRDRAGATPQARLLGALLVKLLQRGRAPLATLEVENTALRVHAVLERTEDLSLRGVEMGWTVSGFGDSVDPDVLVAALSQRREFVLDAGLGFPCWRPRQWHWQSVFVRSRPASSITRAVPGQVKLPLLASLVANTLLLGLVVLRLPGGG